MGAPAAIAQPTDSDAGARPARSIRRLRRLGVTLLKGFAVVTGLAVGMLIGPAIESTVLSIF